MKKYKQVSIGSTGLSCWIIPNSTPGFTGGQYKIAYKIQGKTLYFKPKKHRMWFYGCSNNIAKAETHSEYTVSHLCHNGNCLNPRHLVLESLAVNKSRNVCPGPTNCNHKPLCLVPGEQYDGDSIVVAWSSQQDSMVEQKL